MYPHFEDIPARQSDLGNRCNLTKRHALLLNLTQKRLDLQQTALGLLFAIDQTTVSRYIGMADEILKEVIVVTPDRISYPTCAFIDPYKAIKGGAQIPLGVHKQKLVEAKHKKQGDIIQKGTQQHMAIELECHLTKASELCNAHHTHLILAQSS